MATPKQAGNLTINKAAPTFEKYVVVGGTWKESDMLQVQTTLDGNEETHNYTGHNAGIAAECDWVIKDEQAPAKKLDVVQATMAVGQTKYFVVTDVSNSDFGGKPLKQSVKLEAPDSLQTVLAGD